MTDTKRPNPFAKFSLPEEEHKTSSATVEHAPVQTTTSAPPVTVEEPVSVASSSDEPKANPFAKFDERHDQEDDKSLSQAMGLGVVAGGYKGARNALEDRKNINLGKHIESGSQGYLSGMLPPNINLTVERLQELTGMPVRTQSEIQAALKKLQEQPAKREAVIKQTPTGEKVRTRFKTTPATEHVDLSGYEIPSKTKFATKGLGTGALAGATAGPALYQAATQEQPLDWTQWSSIVGALPTLLPKTASRIPVLNEVAPFLGIPYAVKNREELLRGMRMNDINPTAFPAGTVGSEESPMQEPARPSPLQAPQMSFGEKMREENRRVFPKKEGTLLDYLSFPAYLGAVAGRRD